MNSKALLFSALALCSPFASAIHSAQNPGVDSSLPLWSTRHFDAQSNPHCMPLDSFNDLPVTGARAVLDVHGATKLGDRLGFVDLMVTRSIALAPELASILMVLAGFGFLGWHARRRPDIRPYAWRLARYRPGSRPCGPGAAR